MVGGTLMAVVGLLTVLLVLSGGAAILAVGSRNWRGLPFLAVAAWGLLPVGGIVGLAWRSGAFRLYTPVATALWRLDPWASGWLLAVGVMGMLAVLVRVAQGASAAEWVADAGLALAIAGFLTAGDALAMVLAWGLLTVCAYGLVVAGSHKARVWRAGFVLLIMNELGTAALLVGAILLMTHAVSGPAADVAALLGLFGLGAKIGLFPFQVWLPVAEPEAPGTVAGILSGVTTAVVLVGLAQWYGWTHPDLTVGWVTVALGVVGGVLGAIHAALDHDAKRVLAYSTVEWMGLAVALLGLSVVFLQSGQPIAAGVALAAYFAVAVMHLGAKTTLFMMAGWVERAGGGRRLDLMGGLFRRAGWLSRWGLLATVALMALPPTGGYLAEWLSLESVFMESHGDLRSPLILVGILLALLAATGATAMLRWYGAVFLGPPRTNKVLAAPHASEVRAVAVGGLLALVGGVGVGWWLPWAGRFAAGPVRLGPIVAHTFGAHPTPALLVSLGGRLFSQLPGTPGIIVFPGPGFTATAPWDLLWIGGAMVFAVWWFRRWWMIRHGLKVRRTPAWSGGTAYRREHAWTATALTHPLRLAFAPVIRLERRRHEGEVVRVESDAADRLIEQGMRPLLRFAGRVADAISRTESGDVSHYLLYVLVTVATALLVLKIHGW